MTWISKNEAGEILGCSPLSLHQMRHTYSIPSKLWQNPNNKNHWERVYDAEYCQQMKDDGYTVEGWRVRAAKKAASKDHPWKQKVKNNARPKMTDEEWKSVIAKAKRNIATNRPVPEVPSVDYDDFRNVP